MKPRDILYGAVLALAGCASDYRAPQQLEAGGYSFTREQVDTVTNELKKMNIVLSADKLPELAESFDTNIDKRISDKEAGKKSDL